MADSLERAGKNYALNGIRTQIREGILATTADGSLSTVALAGTEFETAVLDSQGDDVLENNTAIEFTIGAGSVGSTAVKIIWRDASGRIIAKTDLETTLLLDTEGTVRLATGEIAITF
jgi:hypothetical protein